MHNRGFRKRLNKFSKAFTLVEMLIVVVIIGILASALLPKLTGYMARTRDLKRHADLRNIAAAIEMYRNNHGEFPRLGFVSAGRPYLGKGVSFISGALAPYLSSLPNDPQKNSCVAIHWDYWYYSDHAGKCGSKPGIGERPSYIPDFESTLAKGEYVYQLSQKDCRVGEVAYLIAKVETPDMANYVLIDDRRKAINLPGSSFHYRGADSSRGCSYVKPESVFLCSSVEKTLKGGIDTPASPSTDKCTYSREDQLFYIVKIQ